jgi:branched-chain amino acid transport system substrate-binding protein
LKAKRAGRPLEFFFHFRGDCPLIRALRWVAALAVAVLVILASCSGLGDDNKPLIIAAVGPLTGPAAPRGKELEQAVFMAVDEVNASGGISGRRFRINVYDDGDQPAAARALALKIAQTPALAVLGQVASSAGFAAGQIYKEQGIPAITGAASELRVTKGNDWFFRLIPDAGGQGRFLADYAHYQFGAREIAVIRERGTAGGEFASELRDQARNEGIRIGADLEFVPAQAKDPAALADIAQKLSQLPKGDIVVLGTQYSETPAVLRVLRDKLGAFKSVGYSSLATEVLSAQFSKTENDRNLPPGYYTDDFHVAAPQLGDVAEYAQTVFASRYKARYGKEPNPEAVRWYEGAQLIFKAVAATGITGADRQADRRRIRDWLASLDRSQSAATGIAGPIYFDNDHNVQGGVSIGVFYEGRLVSAPVQFTAIADPEQVPGWEQLVSKGMVVDAGGTKMVKTPVVYAGMDLNSLDNIDVRTSTFAADFFLWLRYQDDLKLDPLDVEFPNAVSGVQLGKEVSRRTRVGFTTVTFRVKGVFHADFELSCFPFDQQSLKIPIQIRNSTSYTLILAYGNTGPRPPMSSGSAGPGSAANSLLASRLWRLKDQIYYRDIVALQSSFGEQATRVHKADVEINRINAEVTIKRDSAGFATKNFLPLVCILFFVLIGYAVPPEIIIARVSIGVTALLTTSVLYQKLASDLPTVSDIIAMDYVFFAFFAFCVTFLLLTVITYETHKAKRESLTKLLTRGGVALTLAILAISLVFVWVRYWGGLA